MYYSLKILFNFILIVDLNNVFLKDERKKKYDEGDGIIIQNQEILIKTTPKWEHELNSPEKAQLIDPKFEFRPKTAPKKRENPFPINQKWTQECSVGNSASFADNKSALIEVQKFKLKKAHKKSNSSSNVEYPSHIYQRTLGYSPLASPP